MKLRSVRRVIPAKKVNMGGIMLDQPLPYRGIDMIDPFLLVHHWDDKMPGNQSEKNLGVGPHPHRGFSPVTFIFKGDIHHRDSLNNSEIVTEGGTQWISSGKGIVHSERPSTKMAKRGGDFELIQWWVNTPKVKKMDPAYYEALQNKDTPKYFSEDKKVEVAVVNGTFKNIKGAIEAPNPMLNLRFELKKGGKIDIEIPKNYNAFIYQLDGTLLVNGNKTTKSKDLTWFENNGEGIEIEATADTRLMLLSGQPLNESVVSYGPFVMTSQSEIMQAIRDYQIGKMGVLIEDF
ncbi:MAG: pirin family protein [Bacteroidia bacterium]